MTNKKGMEMSINVVTALILGLLMFGAGVTIFTNIYSRSLNLSLEVDEAIRQRMMDSNPSGDLLYFLETDITSTDNDAVYFYFGIHNIRENATNFTIQVHKTDPPGGILPDKAIYKTGPQEIKAKNNEIFVIIVEPEDAPRGQHGLKVNVQYEKISGDPNSITDYTSPQVIRVNKK